VKPSYDVFSETNPAYVACLIATFIKSFCRSKKDGIEIHLLYIAVPILLSGDFSDTFKKTNKNTGLFEWLERSPLVKIGLSERLNLSMSIVTEAIRLGCFTNIIKIETNGIICLGPKTLGNIGNNLRNTALEDILKISERFGNWFAHAGSSRAILNMLELSL